MSAPGPTPTAGSTPPTPPTTTKWQPDKLPRDSACLRVCPDDAAGTIQHEPASVGELRTYTALGRAFVIDIQERPGVAAGYLLLDEVDGLAHLEQVSVDPAYSNQGLGSLLVERAATWAREHGYPALTLTTFTGVAWNGPWYGRLGFRVVESLTPDLRAIRDREKAHGLDRWPRAAMRLEL